MADGVGVDSGGPGDRIDGQAVSGEGGDQEKGAPAEAASLQKGSGAVGKIPAARVAADAAVLAPTLLRLGPLDGYGALGASRRSGRMDARQNPPAAKVEIKRRRRQRGGGLINRKRWELVRNTL